MNHGWKWNLATLAGCWLLGTVPALAQTTPAGSRVAGIELAANAEDLPKLERHYSVDESRNKRPVRKRWGAVAEHRSHTFFVWGHAMESMASAAVKEQCESQVSEDHLSCRVVKVFARCAASSAAYHAQQDVVSEGATLEEAENASLAECEQESGDSCARRWSYCTDGTGQVYQQAESWGAIARPADGGGEAVLVKDRKDPTSALTQSSWHCEQANKRDCETLFHFAECAAYAESADQNFYGWSRADDQRAAEREALASCKQAAGSDCSVRLSGCNGGQEQGE